MPLRNHFRPPLSRESTYDGLHGQWAAVIVDHLNSQLPARYAAAPKVHTGSPIEPDEYEVQIFDARRGRTLFAAIEIVSPANKDRPEHRNLFVAKCAALLRNGVAVSVVDIVSSRHANLYTELLHLIGHADPTLGDPTPPMYAASCRWVRREPKSLLQAWSHALAVGQPLPTLPLWLAEELAVPLDLELCYERACRQLRIR